MISSNISLLIFIFNTKLAEKRSSAPQEVERCATDLFHRLVRRKASIQRTTPCCLTSHAGSMGAAETNDFKTEFCKKKKKLTKVQN